MPSKVTSEEKLQAECFQWFWNYYPHLRRSMFAVPNGGARHKNEASRMKATGTVSGVSDLIWVLPNRVIFIEMKTTEGKQSETQILFERMVTQLGHRYKVIRTVEEFKRYVWSNIDVFGGLNKVINFTKD